MADLYFEDHSLLDILRMRAKHGIKCSSQNWVQDQLFSLPFMRSISSIHNELPHHLPKQFKTLSLCTSVPSAGWPLSTLTKPLFLPMTSSNVIYLSEVLPDAHQAISHFLHYIAVHNPHLEHLLLQLFIDICCLSRLRGTETVLMFTKP